MYSMWFHVMKLPIILESNQAVGDLRGSLAQIAGKEGSGGEGFPYHCRMFSWLNQRVN